MPHQQQTKQPVRWGRRFGLAAIGHSAKQVEEFLFDWLLYGAVVAWATTQFGSLWGSVVAFAVMTPLSIFICLLYMAFYDWTKKDWFGFEAVKGARDDVEESRGFWKKIMRSIMRLGDIPAFILLSINSDPFMTTVYMRKGADQYNGMTKRDWRIFYGSAILANGYWTLRWTVIVALLAWVWVYIPIPAQDFLIYLWEIAQDVLYPVQEFLTRAEDTVRSWLDQILGIFDAWRP